MLKKYGDFIADCACLRCLCICSFRWQLGCGRARISARAFSPSSLALVCLSAAPSLPSAAAGPCALSRWRPVLIKVLCRRFWHFYFDGAYAVLLKDVGFVICSSACFCLSHPDGHKAGDWNIPFYLALTVALVLAVYFVFKGIFSIRLPTAFGQMVLWRAVYV